MSALYRKKIIIPLKKAAALALVIILSAMNSYGGELPLYLSYSSDFPASMIIPKGRLELNINYGKVNSAIDVLKIRKQELKSISSKQKTASLGNYDHIGININYGLSYHSMIHAKYLYRLIDYGSEKLKVSSYEISLRKSFGSVVALDFGIKGDVGQNQRFNKINDINYYLHKFRSDVSIDVDPSYVWFIKNYPDMIVKYGVPRTEDPNFSIKDMSDTTGFIRLTVGKAFEIVYPNLFLEYGRTKIDTEVDTNLKDMIPAGFQSKLPELPINLSRNESYLKAGLSVFIRTPFKTFTHLQYSYIRLQRGSGLGYINYNHIISGSIGYFISKNIILSTSLLYLHRQFNGVVPFMYNKYSQTTFDHRYGWAGMGLTFLWR